MATRRSRRVRAAKYNPLGISGDDGASLENKSSGPEVLAQLSTGTPSQKAMACHAIAHYLQMNQHVPAGQRAVQELIKGGGLKMLLLNLYNDFDLKLSLAAAGALRNVLAVGGQAAAEALAKEDALTTVLGVLGHPEVKKAEAAFRNELFTQLMAILTSLVEVSEAVTQRFTSTENLLSLVFSQLAPTVPSSLAVEAGSLLLAVSEDNLIIAKQITGNEAAMKLLRDLMSTALNASPAPTLPLSALATAAINAAGASGATPANSENKTSSGGLAAQLAAAAASGTPVVPGKPPVSPQVAVAASGILLNCSSELKGQARNATLQSVATTLAWALGADLIGALNNLSLNLEADRNVVEHKCVELESQRGGPSGPVSIEEEEMTAAAAEAEANAASADGSGVAPMSEEKEEEAAATAESKQPQQQQQGSSSSKKPAGKGKKGRRGRNMADDFEYKDKDEDYRLTNRDPHADLLAEYHTRADDQVNQWVEVAQSVAEALAILTNLCHEVEEDVAGCERRPKPASLALLNALTSEAMLARVAQKCSLKLEQPELVERLKKTIGEEEIAFIANLLETVRVRSITCLSSITSLPDSPEEAKARVRPGAKPCPREAILPQILEFCVASLARLAPGHEAGNQAALEEMEAVLSLLWAALRRAIEGREAPLITGLDKAPRDFLIKLVRDGKTSHIKLNAVGIVGLLGQLPAHFDINFVIGTVLLQVIKQHSDKVPEASLEVVAEVVNSIIDIYKEDGRHTKVIADLRLLDLLSTLPQHLAEQSNVVRKEGDELLADRLAEAAENLAAFIEYKRAHP